MEILHYVSIQIKKTSKEGKRAIEQVKPIKTEVVE